MNRLKLILSQNLRMVGLGAMILVVAVLESLLGATAFRPLIQRLINPIRTQAVSAGHQISKWQKGVVNGAKISEQLVVLQADYTAALSDLAEMEQIKNENAELRSLLDQSKRFSEDSRIVYPILSLSSPSIQAGSDQGVVSGSMVILHKTLIGLVAEVSEHQSVVKLLTQISENRILAKVAETGVQGIILGDGQRVIMNQVPKNETIEVGQKIVTVGQIGVAPNVFIGTVAKVESSPESPYQVAVIEQLVSFYDSVVVEVQQ